ncbi:preprotein translocase subunit SecG [compost metagenome]
MTTFIGILHIIVALVLIILVLIQDSKSDGALGMGGSSGGSNSLLGATGAQTLAGKMTVWSAVIFAVTCLTLSVLTASNTKSVVDSLPLPTAPAASAPATAPEASAPATATAPAATEAAPAPAATTK